MNIKQTQQLNNQTKEEIDYVTCCFSKEKPLIERARAFIQNQYAKLGYVGYNADFDRMFDEDDASRYFLAINSKEEILATSRIVMRGAVGLPIEHGLFYGSNEKVILEDGNIAEMNSFASTSFKIGNKVLSMSTDFILEKDFKITYGLFDLEKPSIGKLYSRIGAVHSPKYAVPIYFHGYGKQFQNKIVSTKWGIMVSDKSKIIAIKTQM
ncbi:LBL_2463 family protein [Leptospira sanjuanensis]|uniref:LBL_2463 family protein n=1 Tax=Leptospira sanjuanensis TaxID=2879643 RepID=UPI001EE943BA|nr:hypothetical protein [Leptospira sanjuanensis]MCG6170199.1 hypothetical protein [Leptospira sanjuanensis]